MGVVCIEDAAYFHLIEETLEFTLENLARINDKWLRDEQVMRMLIKSRTTLQKLRDEVKQSTLVRT